MVRKGSKGSAGHNANRSEWGGADEVSQVVRDMISRSGDEVFMEDDRLTRLAAEAAMARAAEAEAKRKAEEERRAQDENKPPGSSSEEGATAGEGRSACDRLKHMDKDAQKVIDEMWSVPVRVQVGQSVNLLGRQAAQARAAEKVQEEQTTPEASVAASVAISAAGDAEVKVVEEEQQRRLTFCERCCRRPFRSLRSPLLMTGER